MNLARNDTGGWNGQGRRVFDRGQKLAVEEEPSTGSYCRVMVEYGLRAEVMRLAKS